MPPPRKKDRLRGSLSPVWEQFPPIETLCGGQAELPGKSHPDEGAKTAPGGGQELCAGCAHGGAAGNKGVWYRESCRTEHPVEQRARPGAKQSPARARSCVQAAPWGNGRQWGFWCREASHWAPPGQGARLGAKTAPGGAGGCLDAGYGCYLPRAIRVIWMHRVGSTARPRIMPS